MIDRRVFLASVTMAGAGFAATGPQFVTVAELLASTDRFAPGTLIGAGRHAYMVQPANIADADLQTKAGALLHVLPEGHEWDLAALGLDPDAGADAAAAIGRLMQRAVNSGPMAIFRCGAARLRLGSRVVVKIPETCRQVELQGGRTVFELTPDVARGAFRFELGDPKIAFAFRNITIESPLDETEPRSNGTAIEIVDTAGGPATMHQVLIEDVLIWGRNGNPSKGRWDRGIYMEGIQYPILRNVVFRQSRGFDPTKTPADEAFQGKGLEFRNCYWPRIYDFKLGGAGCSHGIHIWGDQSPDFEGFTIVGCEVPGPSLEALVIEHLKKAKKGGVEPGGHISGCHFKGFKNDIRIANHAAFSISHLDMTTYSGVTEMAAYPNQTEISLYRCEGVVIADFALRGGGYFNGIDDCTRGIYLDADCTDIVLSNLVFGMRGVVVFSEMANDSLYLSNVQARRIPNPEKPGEVIKADALVYSPRGSRFTLDGQAATASTGSAKKG